MAVSIIPFKMPEPMEIPEHIVSMLRELPKHDAVAKAMELLIEIDAAHTTIYEAVDDDGNLHLKEVLSTESATAGTLKQQLDSGEIYGKRLTQAGFDVAEVHSTDMPPHRRRVNRISKTMLYDCRLGAG